MLATLFTRQLLFDGVVQGMVFGLVAMGIVLVYRSTRVINFAVANLGIIGAGLFVLLVAQYDVPFWIAAVIGLVVGTLAGAIVELVVIRRLFTAPRVIVLVATIGVAELCQAVTRALPDYRTGSLQVAFPSPITSEWHPGAGITLTGAQLLSLIVVPIITIALWWLLGHTRFGEAVRASVSNPDLARLTGINPKLVSTAVWSIAGFLSAV